MAKRNRLDTLLRIRTIEEDRAKATFGAALSAQRAAEERREELVADYESMVTAPAAPVFDAGGFARHQASRTAMALAIMQAARACVDEAERVAEASAALAVASRRTQGLEKLIDRAAQAHEAEILAADQRTAEESNAAKQGGIR